MLIISALNCTMPSNNNLLKKRCKAENDDIVITIRLLVKGHKVGTIIGKGGDRISAMRKDSGCQIKIQGNDQHIEQIVTISGSLNGTFSFCTRKLR